MPFLSLVRPGCSSIPPSVPPCVGPHHSSCLERRRVLSSYMQALMAEIHVYIIISYSVSFCNASVRISSQLVLRFFNFSSSGTRSSSSMYGSWHS